MPKDDKDSRQSQISPRDHRSGGASPSKSHVSPTTQNAAAGDEPLNVPVTLVLDQLFRFDRGMAKRLRMREVNAKEAFTVRDSSGSYFRASVKEYDSKGGLAVAYER